MNTMPNRRGFTLVELLVVIAILGILVTIGLVSFRTSQARGRDAQRKSDLKQISSALELYLSDYGNYPDSVNGAILGCPSTSSVPCVWGDEHLQLTDDKTVYMKLVPKDPDDGRSYYYRSISVGSVPNMGFQIFAALENTQDSSLISTVYTCGSVACNFAVTSANTSPSD